MLEPSKPSPCSNISADNSVAGIEKCCHNPGTSINLKSTISALCFFAISKASLTDMYVAPPLTDFIKCQAKICYHILNARATLTHRLAHYAGSNPNPCAPRRAPRAGPSQLSRLKVGYRCLPSPAPESPQPTRTGSTVGRDCRRKNRHCRPD